MAALVHFFVEKEERPAGKFRLGKRDAEADPDNLLVRLTSGPFFVRLELSGRVLPAHVAPPSSQRLLLLDVAEKNHQAPDLQQEHAALSSQVSLGTTSGLNVGLRK